MTFEAQYDSEADALSVAVVPGAHADFGDQVHPRGVVAVAGGRAIDVEVLYPSQGLDEPLAAAAGRYELDLEGLQAAARSALAAPDRQVRVDVAKGPA